MNKTKVRSRRLYAIVDENGCYEDGFFRCCRFWWTRAEARANSKGQRVIEVRIVPVR